MAISKRRLDAVVVQLRSRPGHEMVRALVNELCATGLDVPASEVDFEVPVPEVRGRLDALFGATVFEFKRDLRSERADAEEQLERYIGDRERAARRRYLGIATDGAEFTAYELSNGRLSRLNEYVPSTSDPRGLLRWLDTAITVREDLDPDAETIRGEFGRDSLVFNRSISRLKELWAAAQSIPEARLKHQLWSQHLEFVYGKLIEPEELFLQHTYLTIVAKTMAVRVLVTGPVPPGELLAGTPFSRIGLEGAVEADFFDWVLLADGGADLVDRVANQVARFRLSEIEVDVLKAIYESLIDPRQRHYLGEYYTPDWLAEWICKEAIGSPLEERVFDPACGSGTFLFHAIRRYLRTAERKGLPLQEALEGCTEHVFGLDVHPVAVLFARVTYLLAIGSERLQNRSGPLNVPVYLGDALQWDVRQFLTEEEVEISVPDETPLRFPGSVAGDPNVLDKVLTMMRRLADQNAPSSSFVGWMESNVKLPKIDRSILAESYDRMRELHEAGRNHIWTYIVRNLTRPLWLSLRKGKPDVVIGNPPWLRYNAMSTALQKRFRSASRERGLWVGGNVATHQDLSAYFFARVVERYLKHGGQIAFVMPLASLSRDQYEGFRSGRFGSGGNVAAAVKFQGAWTFDSDVQPLFPVPAAVLFAVKSAVTAAIPDTVTAFGGTLPRRDASALEARRALAKVEEPWPTSRSGMISSPYRDLFKQGATIVPRRLMVVLPAPEGKFGVDKNAPPVVSRIGAHDKRPWRDLPGLSGQIEKRFLRPLYVGESIAPFRVLRPLTAIVPQTGRRKGLLDAQDALDLGFPHLATWLRTAGKVWNDNRSSSMTLNEQLDYYGKLSAQYPISPLRVVYAKAGTNPASAVIEDDRGIIDHKLYWMAVATRAEANYLVAILNSAAASSRVRRMQSEGLFGPRDFDKVMFNLPIAKFDRRDRLHRDISDAGGRACQIASELHLADDQYFQTSRRNVRRTLSDEGISDEIDTLVNELLDGVEVEEFAQLHA